MVRFCQRVKCHFNCGSTNVVHLFLHVQSINVNNFLTMKNGQVDRQKGKKGGGKAEREPRQWCYLFMQPRDRARKNAGKLGVHRAR